MNSVPTTTIEQKRLNVYIHPKFINRDFEKYVRSCAQDLLLGEYFKGSGYVVNMQDVLEIGSGRAPLYSPDIVFNINVSLEFLNPRKGQIYDMELGSLTTGGVFMQYKDLFRVFVSLSKMPSGSAIDIGQGKLRLTRERGDSILISKGDTLRIRILSSKITNNAQYYIGDISGYSYI